MNSSRLSISRNLCLPLNLLVFSAPLRAGFPNPTFSIELRSSGGKSRMPFRRNCLRSISSNRCSAEALSMGKSRPSREINSMRCFLRTWSISLMQIVVSHVATAHSYLKRSRLRQAFSNPVCKTSSMSLRVLRPEYRVRRFIRTFGVAAMSSLASNSPSNFFGLAHKVSPIRLDAPSQQTAALPAHLLTTTTIKPAWSSSCACTVDTGSPSEVMLTSRQSPVRNLPVGTQTGI